MGGTLQKIAYQPEDLGEQNTAKDLRAKADKLHKLWRDCKVAHAVGTTAGIAGGGLTIGGGIATMMTARAARPLLLLGMSIGVAGAGTNLIASTVNSSTNSKETLQHDVNNTFQKWLDRKEGARLLYIVCLAVPALNINVSVIDNLEVLSALPLASFLVELAKRFALEAVALIAQGAGIVAQAGATPGGGKLAGRLIIGASTLFLVWDAIDLGYAIRDMVENKGSEEAICLRRKADELDKGN
ncbi:hypothetical protein ACROYT_G026527 [Oculina patagonica]